MAERAQATSSLSLANDSTSKPSIFELLSQESLMNGLRPALRQLFKFLGYRQLLKHFDEAYLGFDVVLQSHYLRKYSGTFSENFYGLKRSAASTGQRLTHGQWLRSLFVAVVLPYLKAKLDHLYEKLKLEYEAQTASNSRYSAKPLGRLCSTFVAIYPKLQAVLELWTLLLQLGYLLSKTDVHSPFLLLAGVKLQNLEANDFAPAIQNHSLSSNATLLQKAAAALRDSGAAVFRSLWKMFGLALFFIQFLDYWYSEERTSPAVPNSVKISPSPQSVYSSNQIAKLEPGKCPICKNSRHNDTALSVSGYVFCYNCIFKFVQTHQRCPITGLPASSQQLVRLYLHSSVVK